MVDNIDVTPGTGKTIAADDVSGVLYQRVKVSVGADGVATDASVGNGATDTGTLRVTVASDSTGQTKLAAGTNIAGKFGIDQTTDGTTNLVAAKQSGAWNVTNVSGTVSLPTGASTAAKQPALGTAGTASTDVITVQGIASAVAIPVTYATATRTSRSGTVTTGGTAQQLMAANSARKGWCLQNNNTTGNIWFDETGGTAVATQPSIKLYPGDFYESPSAGATPTAISIIGDTTGMIFSAREW
jgi:hypothetical protein